MSDVNPNTQSSPIDDLIDLRELISVFRRRFWTLIAAGTLTFVAVVLFTLQATPLYTATSSVVLNVRQSQVVDIEAVLSGMPPDSAMVDTEVEVLRSRSLAETVVDSLDLTNVPEFNRELQDPGGLSAILSGLKSFAGALMPRPAASQTREDADQRTRESVVTALMEARSIRRAGLTYVIQISATSETPSLARDIANAYADAYLTSQLEAKFEATERANVWLNDRVETLREEVLAREEAVARFRDQAGLIDAEGATVAEQQVADLNSQLAIQRAELSEARARLDAVRSQLERGVASDTIAEVLASDVIRELRRQQAEVARRQADLSGRYGPRHPEILTVQRELADINSQIDAEINRIVASLENEVNVSAQRVRSLQNSLLEARGELSENNSAIVQLRALEREADASRALFESFLNRFRQTNETGGLTEADARIVAEASTPQNPSSPNVMLNLALGVVLAGIVGVGLVFALEMLDTGIHTDADIEKNFGLAHIASVPRLKVGLADRFGGKTIDPAQYVLEKPLSGFSESFRTIRSAIRISGIDNQNTIIAVTSALPGDGKTTTSICLGRISAMAGSKTLVLDCDLRRRLLTEALNPEAESGLLEILSGAAKLDDVIVKDAETDLDILPVAQTTFTPRDVFGSTAFETMLEQLRERYDLIILDTAPVLAVADTRAIVSKVDGVLLAVRWKKSAIGIVRKALHEVQASKANVLGVILNNVDLEAQARYGYDKSGYYYRSYQKYYTD
ncbi:polysaccharide biosynthesis tyrosine autokinase [Oceanicaulis alexandrii]|uniref:polysaccharide biosynthesis tyrosine autokinase n=1 Tax=Oceanicaulis alexandrii TaxID=153233 RepID=UPI003BB00E38